MILCESQTLSIHDLPGRVRGELPGYDGGPMPADLDQMALSDAVGEVTERLERRMIVARLAAHGNNRTATAESLGISRKTLFNKMRQYGLDDDTE